MAAVSYGRLADRQPSRRSLTVEISPRHADILAHAPHLTDQDLADYASFVTGDEGEQAAIVAQIKTARTAT